MKFNGLDLTILQLFQKPGKKIETLHVLWTLEQAHYILENHNPINRNCPGSAVNHIAADMSNGDYALTHQGVAFDVKGNLIDGQTRLQSIVASGVATVLPTTFNLPEIAHTVTPDGTLRKTKAPLKTQDMVDHGRARNFADMLTFEQLKENSELVDIPGNKLRATLTKAIANHAIGASGLPNAQLIRVYEMFQEDIEKIVELKKKNPSQPIYSKALVLGCIAFARKMSPASTDKFVVAFFKGTNLQEGDPAYALRNRLLALEKTKGADNTRKRCVFHALLAQFEKVELNKLNPNTDTARDRIRAVYDDSGIIPKIRKITGIEGAGR